MSRVVGVLVACVVAGVLLATPPAVAATATTVTPAVPMASETFTVSAVLPGKVARPARLQKYLRGSWRTVKSQKTSATGKVSFTTTTTSRVAVRIQAPRTRIRSRTYAKRTTTKRTVSVAAQSVSASWKRGEGDDLRVSATVLPARTGRSVRVETRAAEGSAWQAVPGSSGVLDAGGRVTLSGGRVGADGPREQARIVASAWKGAPSTTGPVADPAGSVVVDPLDLAGRRPGEVVTLTATARGTVDRVRFLVDGQTVGVDASAPFTAPWTVQEGSHDVVARAYAGRGSMLSAVLPVRVVEASVAADSGVVEGFGLEEVQSGFDVPTSAAAVEGGPVFVTEKSGRVKVIAPEGEQGWSAPRLVLDLTSAVLDEGDAGLIGIATDPDFLETGHVFLSYALDSGDAQPSAPTSQQVVRYTWDTAREHLDPDSRHVVLGSVTGPECHDEPTTDDCLPLIGQAHTVGDLAFDADGNLVVGVGDGALYAPTLAARTATLRAQDPRVLAGKVLRVDPTTGRGVPANPRFSGDGSDNSSRVVAMGFRNPFRFTVDGARLIVGDVGEGAAEEIDVVALDSGRLANYGWPCREGDADTDVAAVDDPQSAWSACTAARAATGPEALVAPVHTYPHEGGGSITAGVFLTSQAYPEQWRGRYLFGDYAQNFLKAARVDDDVLEDVRTLADATAAAGPVKMLTGPDGLAWYLSIYTGSLRRIVHTPAGAAGDRCAVGSFRRTFHDLDGADSVFDRTYEDGPYRWLFPYADAQLPAEGMGEPTCEPGIRLAPTSGSPWTTDDSRPHPGDRFGTAWRGRVELGAGRYRFAVDGSEWLRLRVDGKPLHDFYSNAFWGDARFHEITLDAGQHVITAELVHGDQPDAYAEVTWERIGGPPEVTLTAPANGTVVAPGGALSWKVAVTDPDGDPLSRLVDSLVVTADLLHYSGGVPHSHPQRRAEGASVGTFRLDDDHAPAHSVWRLRASAKDSAGSRGTSAPVYVCLTGNRVGPCES